jgi:CheY-like chemotaxis protein
MQHPDIYMGPTIDVLLVEDEPLTALVTAKALRKLPAVQAITLATDGEDALQRLRSGEVPAHHLVILTDLTMPRMNGFQLVAELAQMPELEGTPVAILTSSTDPADRDAALALHVDFFVKRGRAYLDAVSDWIRGYVATLAEAPASAAPPG